MVSQNSHPEDLMPGFISAEKGGVVRLAALQSQGYLLSQAVRQRFRIFTATMTNPRDKPPNADWRGRLLSMVLSW